MDESRKWTQTQTRFEDLPKAQREYRGFCPILPRRITFETDLGVIVRATRKRGASKKKGLEGIWEMTTDEVIEETKRDRDLLIIPLSEQYWDFVGRLREFFFAFVGGDIQPMTGRVGLEVDVVYPSDEDYERWGTPEHFRTKEDIDNCFKGIQDALAFRRKTSDGQQTGILIDDTQIHQLRGSKHKRGKGERKGFYFHIRMLDEDEGSGQAILNESLASKTTTEQQRRFAERNAKEHSEKWEQRLCEGLNATTRSMVRLSLLANDSTPLDPSIAQHYIVLRQEFNREVASKFALDEQSEISYRKAVGDEYESKFCEIEEETSELAEKHNIDLSVISKPMSIRELNHI